MTLSLTVSREEEAQILSKVKELFPAVAGLIKEVKLENGQIRAKLDTPLGKLDTILNLYVTGSG